MNRLKEDSEPEAVTSHAGEYFVVSGKSSDWYVSTEMARFIETALEAEPRIHWVKFVDLTGSRIRLRIRDIDFICQSTAEQRAADRKFCRARVRERKADRDWSDDE